MNSQHNPRPQQQAQAPDSPDAQGGQRPGQPGTPDDSTRQPPQRQTPGQGSEEEE